MKKGAKFVLTRCVSPLYSWVMPNQRDKNKKLFSVSMDKKVLAQIEAACKELGITRVEFLRLAAEEKLSASKNKGK